MKRILLLCSLIATLFVTSCEVDTTPSPSIDTAFDIRIVETTRTTATFDVTPADTSAEYFCYVVERTVADDFARDIYLASHILQVVGDEASDRGLTLEEYMAEATDRGSVTDIRFSGLNPATEYYVVAFGVDASREYAATQMFSKSLFTTATVPMSECEFEVTTSTTNNNVVFDVTPSLDSQRWHLFTLTLEEYEHYTSAEGYGLSDRAFYEFHLQRDIDNMRGNNLRDEEIISALIFDGALRLEAKGLKANTEYCYLVAGILLDDEGLAVNTPISVGRYTAGDVVKSSMTFDIKVWDIEQLACSFSITPSNDNDKYCALVQPWDGVSTAEEVMHQIVTQWDNWMATMANDRGHVEHSGTNKFKLPAADTLYSIIAFGYDGGITTDAAMVTFRTLPGGRVEDVVFTMQCSRVSHYTLKLAVTSSDPTMYYIPGVCVADEYDEAEVVAMEEEIFNYYYTEYQGFNPSITYAELLDQYYYIGDCNISASGLVPDTEYMGYVYIFDTHTGKIVRCVTFDDIAHTEPLSDVVPGIELVGYFSGDDEAGSIFGKPEATVGKAIIAVKFNNLDDVRTLYTAYVEGDCTNSYAYSDAEIMRITEGYWSTCKIAEPYMFFTAGWNDVYTALAYATNNNGKMGHIARLHVQPTAYTKRPISELHAITDLL
ncbi:MAG: hypothetical protein IJ464_01790 [Alistipes sp.]|nr:hypothetical protein [Alistipes sp.]